MKILPPLLILIILILSGVIFHQCETKRNMESSLKSVIAQKDGEIHYRRTKDSLSVASQSTAVLSYFNEASKYYAKEINALRAEMELSKKEAKNLTAMVRTALLIRTGGIVKTIPKPDTLIGITDNSFTTQTARFKDKHFDIKVTINPDSTQFENQYSATLTTATFRKKKWLFGKESYWVNAVIDDKNANIIGLTNIEIKDVKDKRIFIGPAVGYDFISGSPSIGIYAGFALFKF